MHTCLLPAIQSPDKAASIDDMLQYNVKGPQARLRAKKNWVLSRKNCVKIIRSSFLQLNFLSSKELKMSKLYTFQSRQILKIKHGY